jgi:hypothetical protein
MLLFVGLVIAVPTITALGIAWAVLSYRDHSLPERHRQAIGISVFVLTVLPVLTLWTFWPLHMAFVSARPALDRLADQVAVGKAVGFPQQAGLFRILGSAVDPASGNVALLTDDNPNGPNGLVRVRFGNGSNAKGPIVGSNLDVNLGGGWSYRDDD